jgi:hypothetical protein
MAAPFLSEKYMKLSFLRSSALAVALLAVAGCGGKAQFELGGPVVDFGGVITPVKFGGMVITNSKTGATVTVPAGATSYKLPGTISYGEEYVVTVTTSATHMDCATSSGTDTAGRLATISIPVACALKTYALKGNITGIPTGGLTLTNGSNEKLVIAKPADSAASAFAFQIPVPYGSSYGITVLPTADGKTTCTVVNGVGTIGGDAPVDITNIAITCTTSF